VYGKILVVCAHPDDDVFGAGALLSTMSALTEIHTIYLGNGVGSRDETPEGDVKRRLDAMEKANGIMGIKNWEVGLFEDQRFDQYPIIELAKWVDARVRDFQPSTIFTHSPVDLNRDHRMTHEAVMVACRPVPESTVKYIYSFEVPSATEWGLTVFRPNVWATGDFLKKAEALKAYEGELREHPHPRSIQGMWNHAFDRGTQCGRVVAEAFELQRMVL